jgi:hypothetical protein
MLALFALAVASLPLGAPTSLARPPLVSAEGHPTEVPTHRWWALQADAGLPDGAGLSLVVMPLDFVRLHAGALATLVGLGARGGVSVVGFSSRVVRPLVGAEAGYAFTGSARWFPFVDHTSPWSQGLDAVSYGWVSAHLGCEIGSSTVAFVLRAGLTYLDVSLAGPRVDVGGTTVTASSMAIRGIVPSARLGLLFTFF